MTNPLDLDLNIADRRAQGRLSLVGSKVVAGSSNQKPLVIRNSAGPVTIRAWVPSRRGDREFDNVDLSTAVVRRAIGRADTVPSTGTFPLAPLSTPVTSGLLVSGKRYFIKTFVAGDSFTNVGAASNATGILFTATGTTPTTWTNGSAIQEVTSDLSVEATAAQVQAALNATAAVTALGGVTVTKLGTGSYEVLFNNLGAQQAMEGPVNWNMTPGSVVSVSRIVPGSATVREVQLIRLLINPYCYAEFSTALPAAAATVSTVQGATADLPATKRITLDPQPYDGHLIITLDDNDPFEVPFDASAGAIQSEAGPLYQVSRKSETEWDISGTEPAQDVAIEVDASKLVVHLGVSGEMPLNTVALHRAFAATDAKTIILLDQVDITWPDELPQKVYQGEIEIARDILDLSTIVPSPIPASDYATLSGLIAGKQPIHANLTAIAALTTHATGLGLLTKDSGNAILSYISGQPLNAGLTAIAALVTAVFGRSLLTAANPGAGRDLLGLGEVENTSDADKPVSTAQAAADTAVADAATAALTALSSSVNSALALKAALAGDNNFTGENIFNLLQTFNDIAARNVEVERLGNAAAPTVVSIGNHEGVTWSYKIVAKLSDGTTSAASAAGSVANGEQTLDSSNYNQITWSAVEGAYSYDIYRTAVGTSPNTLGKIANVSALTYNDTGAAGDGSTAPTANATGHVAATGRAAFALAHRIVNLDDHADAAAVIAAIIDDLPDTGGVIYAYAPSGSVSFTSNPFADSTKPITLCLGPGTFHFDGADACIVLKSNQRLIGSGEGQTILKLGDTQPGLGVLVFISNSVDAEVSRLTIDGTSGTLIGHGIFGANVTRPKLTELHFIELETTSGNIYLANSTRAIVDKIRIDAYAAGWVLFPDDGGGVGHSIMVVNSALAEDYHQFSNISIHNGGFGLLFNNSNRNQVSNFVATATAHESLEGINLENSSDNTFSNITIIGRGDGGFVENFGCARNNVTGLIVGDNWFQGLYTLGADSVYSGVIAFNNGFSDNNRYGVLLDPDAIRIRLYGVHAFDNRSGAAVTQEYGIRVGPGSEDNVIIGATGYGNESGLISDAGTDTGIFSWDEVGNAFSVSALTIGSGGAKIAKVLSRTFTVDFAGIPAGTTNVQVFAFPGAADGDTAILAIPAAVRNNYPGVFSAWVNATNQVALIYQNTSAVSQDIPGATYRVTLIKF